ncbi:MAG: glycosyltransferase [Methylophilus sp.]|nr:glycosyltransferase [Methylophilus sp.]
MSFKSNLLRINLIYLINKHIKSFQVKHTYNKTRQFYNSKEANVLKKPKKLLSFHNIFFLGTDEQQDRSGTLQALNKSGELTYFTREDGSYGQNDTRIGEARRQANTQRLWEMVTKLAEQNKAPDVLIAQTWACLISPEVFSRIRNAYGTFIINISMDDRHQYWGDRINGQWSGTYPLIPHIDLALTAAPEAVDWYKKEGCPAIFFPEASDPDIFYPMPELPKIHEVSFVGACYGIRKKIVVALRKAGINVTAYGNGWGSGRLEVDEVPKLFAQSKIILGIGTIGHCDDFYALKLRDFDAPMSGSFYLTHNNSDLYQLFDVGKEIVTYESIDECVKLVKYYLDHEEEREEIAQAGRKRALNEHTWKLRFSQLFEQITAP